MLLSKDTLAKISPDGLTVPRSEIFELPEKVLQFGTGVLLRGLPDYFIDKANREGIFNGRVVVVKSTGNGPSDEFDRQDSLYTLNIKGIENGAGVDEQIICSAISRVLTAGDQWAEILNCAHDPEMMLIISNTTEVGIAYTEDSINHQPPASFPGKLLTFLHERYEAFNGDAERGMIIIPTELIVDNGDKLKGILIRMAENNGLDAAFIQWLAESNTFCNSLVDRIVPGKPNAEKLAELTRASGYTDELRITAEPYALWAIQGDERIAAKLSFSQAHEGVVITPDIEKFRELKLRLLNGTHSLTCAVAFLSGFSTVKEAMQDAAFKNFMTALMNEEIIPAIPYKVNVAEAEEFAAKVIDRFSNPNIEHLWLSISVQYSSKIKLRVVPLLLNHYKQFNTVPQRLAFGFAEFIRFMQVQKQGDKYVGEINGITYNVTDDNASIFSKAWALPADEVVNHILADTALWGADLTALTSFAEAVDAYLAKINHAGTYQEITKF